MLCFFLQGDIRILKTRRINFVFFLTVYATPPLEDEAINGGQMPNKLILDIIGFFSISRSFILLPVAAQMGSYADQPETFDKALRYFKILFNAWACSAVVYL